MDAQKLIRNGVAYPVDFVRREFQEVFKKNAKELFEANPNFFKQFDGLKSRKMVDWEDLFDLAESPSFTKSELIEMIIKVE